MKKNIIIIILILVMIVSLAGGLPKYVRDTISRKLNIKTKFSDTINANQNDNSKRNEGNLILVNKNNGVSENYKPADLTRVNVKFYKTATAEEKTMRKEAAQALEELFNGAENEGVELYGLNGYRSYQTQKTLFDEDCEKWGTRYAEQCAAKPGYSEHQTGLAMDITNRTYSTNFQTTKEGKWLAKNCYKYGFILRYPQGKENITGYSYEPWHVRYVGKTVAKQIFLKNIVLEQYLNK